MTDVIWSWWLLHSRKDYRKGLGTALVSRFMDRAVADGARNVRLLTNTLASWEFMKKEVL